MLNNVSINIKNLRKKHKLTLKTLGKKLGLAASSLSRIERGELNINAKLLQRLADELNTSPQAFFSDSSSSNNQDSINPFIKNFRLSAKFINQFNKKTFVIAVGGEVVDDNQFQSIAYDINLLHSLNINIVLVHGIRPQIEQKIKKGNRSSKLIRNHRVTGRKELDQIMEINGKVKTEIEAMLSSRPPDSPMSESDITLSSGNFITAKPIGVIDGVDMEFTGQIRKVNGKAITDKLINQEIVIISPLGFSPIGEIFNLPYEQTAAFIAQSIKAEKLIYYVSTNGILNIEGKLIPELTTNKAEKLIEHIENKSSPEQAPHISYTDFNILKSSLFAIKNKIEKVHLINRHIDGSIIQEIYTDKGAGTILTEYPLEDIRQARFSDITHILNLIEPLSEQGVLIKRIAGHIRDDINSFYVIEHDHNIIGTAALYEYNQMIEIACFVIHPNYQRLGYGEKLLKFCEKKIQEMGIKSIFALTTQSEHWFIEKGFNQSDKKFMPNGRNKIYDIQRNSKFLTKNL